MRHDVGEWQRFPTLELTDQQVRALARSKAFEISPDSSAAGRWTVRATQYVGAAHFDGLDLRVTPKVGVHRLFELLCTSIDRVEWSDEDAAWVESDDLVATVTGAFVSHAERALRQGLVQGYHRVDASMLGVRGRVSLGRQLAKNPGLPLPIEVTYDDYTADVVENQLVAGAGRVLLQLPGLPPMLSARLRRLEYRLIDVTPARPEHRLPEFHWTRLNERYRSVIGLARMILQNATLEEQGDRDRTGTAFLVDMNRVFEDVIGIGLRAAAAESGFGVELQFPIRLGGDENFHAMPDVVIKRADKVVAVADVKYISARKGISTGELYQAVTYATHFGLDTCTLIYPEPQRVGHVTIGPVTVNVDYLDLDQPAEERSVAIRHLMRRLVMPDDRLQPSNREPMP